MSQLINIRTNLHRQFNISDCQLSTYKGIPNKWRSNFWFFRLDPVGTKVNYERKQLDLESLYVIGKCDAAVVRQVHLDVARKI